MDWKLISLTDLYQHRGPCATRGRYAGRPPHSRYAARPPHDRYAEPLRGAETFLRMDIRKNKSLSLCGSVSTLYVLQHTAGTAHCSHRDTVLISGRRAALCSHVGSL